MENKVIAARNKAVKIGVLIMLFIVLVFVVIYQLLPEKKVPDGALRVVMCLNPHCRYKTVRRIVNIQDPKYRCEKCNGRIGYAWKCGECDFEFAYDPGKIKPKGKKTMDMFRAVVEARACPNCNSNDTFPIPVVKEKKK